MGNEDEVEIGMNGNGEEEEENILTLLGGTGESDYEDEGDDDGHMLDNEAHEDNRGSDDDDDGAGNGRLFRRRRRRKGQKESPEERFNRLVSDPLFIESLPLDVHPLRESDLDAENDYDPDRQLEDDQRHRLWELTSFKKSTIIKFSKAVSLFVLEYAKVVYDAVAISTLFTVTCRYKFCAFGTICCVLALTGKMFSQSLRTQVRENRFFLSPSIHFPTAV